MISFQARLSVRIQSIGKSTNGIPGGKLSLGRLESGSGYCVGGIVETKAGIKDIPGQIRGKEGVLEIQEKENQDPQRSRRHRSKRVERHMDYR